MVHGSTTLQCIKRNNLLHQEGEGGKRQVRNKPKTKLQKQDIKVC